MPPVSPLAVMDSVVENIDGETSMMSPATSGRALTSPPFGMPLASRSPWPGYSLMRSVQAPLMPSTLASLPAAGKATGLQTGTLRSTSSPGAIQP